jgi:hypothetical protein
MFFGWEESECGLLPGDPRADGVRNRAMVEDFADEGDDLHFPAAFGTKQRVDFSAPNVWMDKTAPGMA